MQISVDQRNLQDGLGRRAARGAVVTVAGQGGRILVQMASVVVLARLLSPSDYGLFAIVTAVAGIAEVFRDFGLSQAAIQAKTLSTAQRDALFWANSLLGLALGVLVYISAPLVATIFGHEALTPLVEVAAVVFVMNGIATQYRAGLSRGLRFTALAAIDLGSTFAGLVVAIGSALVDAGVWALILQFVTQAAVGLVAAALCARWLPRIPPRGTRIRPLLRFGWHMVATQIVTYAGNNADTVTIGLAFGAAPLGIYNRAFQLVMRISNQLRAPITDVAIPVLSRLQDSRDRYWEFARVGQVALGYTIVAGLALVTGASVPLTDILLGHKWLASAPLLSLLAASAILQTLGYFAYWVYVSRGITGALFQFNMVSVVIKIACMVVGAFWGVTGVAAGYLVAAFVTWPLSLVWIARSLTNVPIGTFVSGFLRMASLAGAAAGAGFIACGWADAAGPWAQLGLAAVAAVSVYAAALVIPQIRSDLRDLLAAASKLRRDRGAR